MQPPTTIRINRAPVLTLWAAVVAERLGMSRDAALTVGQALAGLTAYSKGVRLGIYAPPEQRPHEAPPAMPKGVKTVRDIHLLGRLVHVAETLEGPRAITKGEVVKPESVERYLRGKFGDVLDAVRAEMERLALDFQPAVEPRGVSPLRAVPAGGAVRRAWLGCEGHPRSGQDPSA